MKANASAATARNKINQKDTTMMFDALTNGSSQRAGTNKYAHNQHTGQRNDDQGHNQTQMPNRKGNVGYNGRSAGHVTAKEGVGVASGARKWAPVCEGNYVGNPDQMQERQMPNRVGNIGNKG
jgi:hypothetical protein